MNRLPALIVAVWFVAPMGAAEMSPAERGKKALEETSFISPAWRATAYDVLWKQWGRKEKPANYADAVMERYGLHPAPFDNKGLPMGLRHTNFLLVKGMSVDCLVCHGGSIAGKSYVGLGNASLDVEALFSELAVADGRSGTLPFPFTNVRGTSEAGSMAVYLLGFREPDLKLRRKVDLGVHADMCEDVPAWWLLKKKKTMYFTGGADARSVRSIMQFMMTPLTMPEDFDRHEAAFKDIQQYLLSLEAPKYPFPVDGRLAEKGKVIFNDRCSSCHGTYGEKWTYPNKIVPLEKIGTDPKRFEGIEERFGRHYNRTWFAREKTGWFVDGYTAIDSDGYQAPPLDGIWATAPYLHNGSVPTLYQVLKSDSRPKRFTRSFKTDEAEYDKKNVGWKYVQMSDEPRVSGIGVPAIELRKIYDTSKPGRGNGGHTFGDDLSEDERWAVIEYLKTL